MDWSKITNSIGLTQNNNNMWGAIASAGAGLLGGLFNSASQDKANKAQLEFARQQFATQVGMYNQGLEFNKAESQRSRDYNTSMLQYQNAYNSPAQQIQRMRAAGLNPDLIYGNGQLGSSSASGNGSPSASAPGAPSGTSYNPQSTRIGDAIMNALSIERQRAEIDAIKANVEKTGTENEILKSDARWRDALNAGDVALKNVNVKVGESVSQLNEQKVKESRQLVSESESRVDEINQRITESQARVESIGQDVLYKRIQNRFASEQFQASLRESYTRIKKMNADIDISYKNFSLGCQQLALQAYGLEIHERDINSQIALRSLEAEGITIKNGQLALDFELDKDFKRFERTVGAVNATATCIGNIIDTVWKPVEKASKLGSQILDFLK